MSLNSNQKYSKNVQLVLEILKDEVLGDVKGALEKMHPEYKVMWIYKRGEDIFPSETVTQTDELEDAYEMINREYDIRHITEGPGVVMLELIESYTDPVSQKTYVTPLVLVVEIVGGKIKSSKHYCDPKLSYEDLKKEEVIQKIYKDRETSVIINKKTLSQSVQ